MPIKSHKTVPLGGSLYQKEKIKFLNLLFNPVEFVFCPLGELQHHPHCRSHQITGTVSRDSDNITNQIKGTVARDSSQYEDVSGQIKGTVSIG